MGKPEQNAEWRRNNIERCIYYEAYRRSKDKNIEFNLSISDIKVPDVCPVLGIPLFMRDYDGQNISSDNSPTLDRIDPKGSYSPENIRVISARANRIKSNGTVLDHIRIVKYIIIHNLKRLLGLI